MTAGIFISLYVATVYVLLIVRRATSSRNLSALIVVSVMFAVATMVACPSFPLHAGLSDDTCYNQAHRCQLHPDCECTCRQERPSWWGLCVPQQYDRSYVHFSRHAVWTADTAGGCFYSTPCTLITLPFTEVTF